MACIFRQRLLETGVAAFYWCTRQLAIICQQYCTFALSEGFRSTMDSIWVSGA